MRDRLIERRDSDPIPSSCGSFKALASDTSWLSRNCEDWYYFRYTKPQHTHGLWNKHLYIDPINSGYTQDNYGYHYVYNKQFCDDTANGYNAPGNKAYSKIGEWTFFVR